MSRASHIINESESPEITRKHQKRVNPTVWNTSAFEDQHVISREAEENNYMPKKYFTIRRAEHVREKFKNNVTAEVEAKEQTYYQRKPAISDKLSDNRDKW